MQVQGKCPCSASEIHHVCYVTSSMGTLHFQMYKLHKANEVTRKDIQFSCSRLSAEAQYMGILMAGKNASRSDLPKYLACCTDITQWARASPFHAWVPDSSPQGSLVRTSLKREQ